MIKGAQIGCFASTTATTAATEERMGNGIEQFVTDRNRAMRSLSELSIREFAANYRIVMPSDSETFWGEVHRVRCHIRTFTEEEQESSRAWLSEHGMDGRPPEVGLFPGG